MSAQTETKITSAHHEIEIALKGQHALPSACPEMNIGDTVRYSTLDGEVKVDFVDAVTDQPASPFGKTKTTITGSALQTVSTSGVFKVHCFVRAPYSTEFIGWDRETSPQSGGQFPVPPNKP
jgi:hypothetical protein